MKQQARFVTRSGTTYVWSWVSEALYRDNEGTLTLEVSRPVAPPRLEIGKRFHVEGWRMDGTQRRWRPYWVDTSVVVSVTYENDGCYSAERQETFA